MLQLIVSCITWGELFLLETRSIWPEVDLIQMGGGWSVITGEILFSKFLDTVIEGLGKRHMRYYTM